MTIISFTIVARPSSSGRIQSIRVGLVSAASAPPLLLCTHLGYCPQCGLIELGLLSHQHLAIFCASTLGIDIIVAV